MRIPVQKTLLLGMLLLGATATRAVAAAPAAAQGTITAREYLNISGTALAPLTSSPRFPNSPDVVAYPTLFEWPANDDGSKPAADVKNNYGTYITGYIYPPTTGDYIFALASDDNGELWLSTDDNPANKKLIAVEEQWNPVRAFAATTRRTTLDTGTADERLANFSKKIRLTAGKAYYIEALAKEGGGGDNLAVAWQKPGDPAIQDDDSPIPGQFLATLKVPPYLKSAIPAPGAILVPLNTSINLVLADTTTAVQPSSVQLFLNGTKITPTINKPAGSTETTISYKPSSDLPRALHTVRLIYGDNATPANVITNEYTFSTEGQLLFTFDDATVWKYNREGLDLGTAWKAPKFDDNAWEKGLQPIGDNSDHSEPVPIRSEISRFNDAGEHITTLYVRGHFNFSGASAAGVTLTLTHMVDDGAVFYLNGVEIHRFGRGAGQAFDFSTFFSGHEAAFSGPYTVPAASLLPGDNVFAAEVHQSDGGSSDIVFGAQLAFKVSTVTDKTPPTVLLASEGGTLDKIQLSFSEDLQIAPAQSSANYSVTPVSGGASLAVNSAVLSSGTNVVLTTAARTAGTAYNVTIRDIKDLSGNTISPNPTVIGAASKKILFGFDDATVWAYNREGKDLGTAWRDPKYDDSKWEKGVGPIGDNSDNSEIVKIRTPISRMNDAGEEYPTLYLRGHFNFPGASTAGVSLSFNFEVDDGAVFYLNGVEVYRFNLAAGATYNFNTLFGGNEADHFSGPVDISAKSLIPGDNVFAVEVHQSSLTSSDIVYGGELSVLLPAVGAPTGAKFEATTIQAGKVTVTWTGAGTLQSAPSVIGPWTDLVTAKSPFTENVGGTKFFRVKQ